MSSASVGSGTSTEENSVDALYRRERHELLRLAFLLTRDHSTAEDVVQEAFIGLHAKWKHLADPGAAAGYLRVSVVNRSRSVHRRRRLERGRLSTTPDYAAAADVQVVLADEERRVVSLVARLPHRQRQVVSLRYWSDLSEAEIAEALGISQGTVKSTAARALAKIARQLEE